MSWWARVTLGAVTAAGFLTMGCHGPSSDARRAPPFTLPLLRGTSVSGVPELAAAHLSYSGATGPYLFIFTDVKSDGERVRYDTLAFDDARRLRIPIWTILSHAAQGTGLSFVFHSQDRSERYLLDDGAVTTAYQAGKGVCWVVVDRHGTIVWQGPQDLDAAHRAMAVATRS